MDETASADDSKRQAVADKGPDESAKVSNLSDESIGESPPPLPPRPTTVKVEDGSLSVSTAHLQNQSGSLRPRLRPQATTALSLTDIFTRSHPDGSHATHIVSTQKSRAGSISGHSVAGGAIKSAYEKLANNENADSASVISYVPASETNAEVESMLESMLGEVLGSGHNENAWLSPYPQPIADTDFLATTLEDEGLAESFKKEFEEGGELAQPGADEGALLHEWKSRLKHFLILSSAGKPIYSRHGDDGLISEYIGIMQTIISSFQSSVDRLKSFTAGKVHFVVMVEGPLYLVAISRLWESDSQLVVQLEALYMQVVSTLTLPTLTTLFSNRPSTDLRRPLQGTEPLLSALVDSFTRGSPPTLLSALECLRMRKSHRQIINNILLKGKVPSLLYGLIVAGGRLVSVMRPRRHSLHPSDLQLIFNMLFEAGGVKAGEGENWIPLCLPAFNNRGYLYMYVSFLGEYGNDDHPKYRSVSAKEDQVAVILISAEKESFYGLKQMRDEVTQQLEKTGSMKIIRSAVHQGRPTVANIAPGTVIRHFLYKSRANVQFIMPSFTPDFETPLSRRKLLSLYHMLHASVHAKNAHLKVHHCSTRDSVSLAWVTPLFELYCVAAPHVSKMALAQAANKVCQWVRREEQRVFIIGGAIF